MNLLAFDTSTQTLRIAVQAGARVAQHEAEGGAKASITLIPAILQMLKDAGMVLADLDAIVFGRGPGSFTGLRTACSVAQGLAFGANVPVLPVDTLMAVAEDARHRCGVHQVVAVLDARMDQVYWSRYVHVSGCWQHDGNAALAELAAPELVVVPAEFALAGNAMAVYGARLPDASRRVEAAPTATALLRLAPALIAAGQAGPAILATPTYIRDKVAQTTEERAALRASLEPRP